MRLRVWLPFAAFLQQKENLTTKQVKRAWESNMRVSKEGVEGVPMLSRGRQSYYVQGGGLFLFRAILAFDAPGAMSHE